MDPLKVHFHNIFAHPRIRTLSDIFGAGFFLQQGQLVEEDSIGGVMDIHPSG
jgi:hypothetical protein